MTKPDRTALQKSLIGPAGEHYVLYQLYRRGLLAAPAPPRTPAVDVLVLSPDGETVAVTVQVKTRTSYSGSGWLMNVKHETVIHDRMVYAFVDLGQDPPVCFIVPSEVVANAVRAEYATWLATPGRGGRPHQANPTRLLRSVYPWPVPGFPDGWLERWQERWDLLEEKAADTDGTAS